MCDKFRHLSGSSGNLGIFFDFSGTQRKDFRKECLMPLPDGFCGLKFVIGNEISLHVLNSGYFHVAWSREKNGKTFLLFYQNLQIIFLSKIA